MTSDDYGIREREALTERYPGLDVLVSDPANAQTASRTNLASHLTPREEHYIRTHHRTPDIDADGWTISLTGLVEHETDLSMSELRCEFPTESVVHMMECSGNSRRYFDPDAEGDQWGDGAVGNAVWTGTSVSAVLDEYGAATDGGLWLSAMGGEAPPDKDVFCRSIPMAKVVDDCLLAYEMNGTPMSAEHGFPVRLIVPGWFGNNSVKWVEEIRVMETMVNGEEWTDRNGRDYTQYQQSSYRITPAQDNEPTRHESVDVFSTYDQLTEAVEEVENAYLFDQLVKSLIIAPADDSTLPVSAVELAGIAWSGEERVERIEISTDGGGSWDDAEFVGPDLGPYAPTKFRYVWEPEPGEHTLCSRATDEAGRTQPATLSKPEQELRGIENDQYPWNQKGYGNNAYLPHAITVEVTE
ncbi:sulfite oxidase [Halococcus sediminicola]|uniref:sulfite oxidase n=1 Tax=Halococcus sediminicola TaxID=1264579 RepID=UPI0006784958|nr:sulfite oxidase [Halococcus sediminicola]